MDEIKNRLAKIGNCDIEIISNDESKDVQFIIFKFDGCMKSTAIVYNTGELFHLKDWQSGYPANKDEIVNFDWVNEEGRDAIVLDGLPRML